MLLQNIKYDISPLSDKIKPYLMNKKDFSLVTSPIYGGGTARAEFEVLSGLHSYGSIESVEFNVMQGSEMHTLLYALKNNNYQTIATIATGKGYFNSVKAYKSLGFEKVYFLEEEKDYIEKNGDKHIFDGDVFKYNIYKIQELLSSNNLPIFSYVLGMYGHFPYDRNKQKRMDIINIKQKDGNIKKILNQFYYRTEAIGNYIKKLQEISPNSIIYITSDHLPPLLNDDIKYKYNKHINISILLKDDKIINVTGKKYYEIPWLIWDILIQNKTKRTINDVLMQKLYFKAMAESIK